MRVLLAIDGSASSDAACRLVGSLTWPEGSIFEVVAAAEAVVDPIGTTVVPIPPTTAAPDHAVLARLNRTLVDAVASLEAPGRIVSRALLHGRPATVIVDEATAFRAEIVVVGSRGLGPLRSMLLGSVSAEIVDHAPCPVLVARRPSVGTILLAVDGSVSANAAVDFLGATRFLLDHPVEVLSVAAAAIGPRSIPPAGDVPYDASTSRDVAARHWAEGYAASATETLLRDGAHARWSISQGHPVHEIIEAAKSFPCDLIVLGSRGLTGLARLVLGSVARNVLLHTEASVLIVHEPLRVRSEAPVVAEEEPLVALVAPS